MAKFCEQCGSPLESGAKFCDSCGAPVEEDFIQEEPAAKTEVVPAAEPELETEIETVPEPESRLAEEQEAFAAFEDVPEPPAVFDTDVQNDPLPDPAPEPSATAYTEPLAQPDTPAYPTSSYVATTPAPAAPAVGDTAANQVYPGYIPNTAPQAGANPYAETKKEKKGLSTGATIAISVAIFLVIVLGGTAGLMAAGIVPVPGPLEALFGGSKNLPGKVNISQVSLVGTSKTTFGVRKDGKSSFPVFKINYPAGWTQTIDNVTDGGEHLEITNADNVSIIISNNESSVSAAWPEDFKEVAAASFKAGKVLDKDMPNAVNMVVARGYSEQVGGYVYALLPQEALGSNPTTTHVFADKIPPAFDISVPLAVYCITPKALDETTEQQVVATIASFMIDDSVEQSSTSEDKDGSSKKSDQPIQQIVTINTNGGSAATVSTNGSGYVFPQSDSSYLTTSDLSGLDPWALCVGRNEIYARHGYSFRRDDLAAYFGAQTWYHATLPVGEFSDSMLNDYERANVNLIHSYEESINSPYL